MHLLGAKVNREAAKARYAEMNNADLKSALSVQQAYLAKQVSDLLNKAAQVTRTQEKIALLEQEQESRRRG
jgi:hypothetical protein